MSENIPAIYEKGVLRPLKPLNLPEHAQVEIQIIIPPSAPESERQRARQALLDAGVIQARSLSTPVFPISEKELVAAARALGKAGSLSELIIAERDEQ